MSAHLQVVLPCSFTHTCRPTSQSVRHERCLQAPITPGATAIANKPSRVLPYSTRNPASPTASVYIYIL